jgi:hypothetical protein
MKKIVLFFFWALLIAEISGSDAYKVTNTLRAPAYPLITIDPYTSGWSFTDKLYDQQVKHWTGKEFPLIGVLRVDGAVFRFMGVEEVLTRPVVQTSELGSWKGRYSFDKPADGWEKLIFNDSKWKSGLAAFGTKNEPTAKTPWTSKHIWVRREILIDEDLADKAVYLEYTHDDDVEIYINGIQVVKTGNDTKRNALIKLPENVVRTLKEGRNIIAAHCYNRVGHALLDFGLSVELPSQNNLSNTAVQKSVEVLPTRTIYTFECGKVDLMITFTAPLLMHDLEMLSRPVNYISYDVKSNDGKSHDVEIYLEAGTAWALNSPKQESLSEIQEQGNLIFLKTGSANQQILAKKGDDIRIDWGYFYLAADKDNTAFAVGESETMRSAFFMNGTLNNNTPPSADQQDKMALARSLGKIDKKVTSGFFMLGYDDIYSIQYFGTNLRPYWNRKGDKSILSVFEMANDEFLSLKESCAAFDMQMMNEAQKAGGKSYAELCALAYRQAITAHKLVEAPNGDVLFLSKENFSNGSIGTVDVTYPSIPLFLYYNTELAKGLLNHIFYYSESGKWTKPFAAHDVGTYPIANGQTYGGDMPVEESGNMLIMSAAIAAVEGNADYAAKHWEVLTTWTDYLVEHGLDPDNQLCTDDFAGHFAHNANLSIKAILGIASYGRLAEILGKNQVAAKYINIAKEMAKEWVKMADDGDHYRLTFDRPGTWSQKYNLVWDKLMQTNIFPKEVAAKEIAYYLTKQNTYGLPLDNRKTYTKSDWIIWTATLANDLNTFEKFINPVHKFMNETTSRVPMTDWYWTDSQLQRGFQARSVVGGYFIKMLEDKMKK